MCYIRQDNVYKEEAGVCHQSFTQLPAAADYNILDAASTTAEACKTACDTYSASLCYGYQFTDDTSECYHMTDPLTIYGSGDAGSTCFILRNAYRDPMDEARNDHHDNAHMHYSYDQEVGLCVLADRSPAAEPGLDQEVDLATI